jgi:hypothetical protein
MRRLLVAPLLVLAAAASPRAERVPDAGVVNGVPQGIFFSRSLLTGRAVCLLFLSEGRVTRFIPAGGLENFDWATHRAAHDRDSGTWTMANGQIRIQWGDGGVNQGPVTVHPDGIEFYGKRYAKPAPVTVAAIAGRWEAARGTAIAGGPGVNRVSTLVIERDGRYQWASTTGGVVAGRATAADARMKGTLAISGATLTLKSDAGSTTSVTFLPAAGSPVQAFTLDADLFTRTQ